MHSIPVRSTSPKPLVLRTVAEFNVIFFSAIVDGRRFLQIGLNTQLIPVA